jgi:parallel beta-helix repeat protein
LKYNLRLVAFLLVLLFCGLALDGFVFFGYSQASIDVSGILQDTTWTASGSPYTLTGNVLVSNGATLTIQPGVIVNFGNFYIEVNGTLAAQGTSDNPIHFNAGQIIFTSFCAPWNQQSTSGCIIQNVVLASTAISDNNAIKIDQCNINTKLELADESLLSNSNVTGGVVGGTLTGNNIFGDVNSPTIVNNVITGNVGGMSISGSTINGGITAIGNCNISNNTISGGTPGELGDPKSGIYLNSFYMVGGGYPRIENNLITNCPVGIAIYVLIRGNTGANIPIIQNNLIVNNDVGIHYDISFQETYSGRLTTIKNNNIEHNGVGIKLVSMDDCVITNNNIDNNLNYNVYLETGCDVNLANNWWGTTDQQAINQTMYDYSKDFDLGRVTFVPFSTSPNPVVTTHTLTPSPTPQPTPTPKVPEFLSATAISTLFIVATVAALLYRRKTVRASD